jgi:CopG family nickel-responsive transcriptional regulator
MSDLTRLSLSLEKPLLDKLDALMKRKAYTNRSEFVRDMIRDHLVQTEWEKDREVLGTITLIYDHHARRLSEKLIDLQHDHHREVLVTTHVHLSHDLCAEVGSHPGAGEGEPRRTAGGCAPQAERRLSL